MQTLHHVIAEAIFGKHTLDGLLHRSGRLLDKQLLHADFFHTAGVRRVAVVDLVASLFLRNGDLRCIHDDDMVAVDLVRGERRLVLATKKMRSLRRDPAEHLTIGINEEPLWSRWFGCRGSHFALEETLVFALSAFPAFSSFATTEPVFASINIRSTIFAPSPFLAPTGIILVMPEERVA